MHNELTTPSRSLYTLNDEMVSPQSVRRLEKRTFTVRKEDADINQCLRRHYVLTGRE